MWGLPDSAILGTAKRLFKSGKKSRGRISPTKSKEIILGQNWSCFNQDTRSFKQLLAEAKQHAQEKEKAGK